jgi:hypothetical protein
MRMATTIAAAVAPLSLCVAPASASGYTVDDAFFCSSGYVFIDAPRVWTNNANTPETVFWAPILYRWDGNAWVDIANVGWSYATVTNQGRAVTPWEDLQTHAGGQKRSFPITQPGHYLVQNFVFWAGDGSRQFTWVPNATPPPASYCTFQAAGFAPEGATDDPSPGDGDGEVSMLRPFDGVMKAVLTGLTQDAAARSDAPAGPA